MPPSTVHGGGVVCPGFGHQGSALPRLPHGPAGIALLTRILQGLQGCRSPQIPADPRRSPHAPSASSAEAELSTWHACERDTPCGKSLYSYGTSFWSGVGLSTVPALSGLRGGYCKTIAYRIKCTVRACVCTYVCVCVGSSPGVYRGCSSQRSFTEIPVNNIYYCSTLYRTERPRLRRKAPFRFYRRPPRSECDV